jgi:hypothetical protein
MKGRKEQMIKKLFAPFIFLILLVLPSKARESQIGAGLIFVEPTGIHVKIWTGRTLAFTGAIGRTLGREKSWRAHADFLFIKAKIFDTQEAEISFYSGVGGRIGFEENNKFRLRIPFGLDFTSQKIPLIFFLETVPMIEFTSGQKVFLRGALGIRYLLSR